MVFGRDRIRRVDVIVTYLLMLLALVYTLIVLSGRDVNPISYATAVFVWSISNLWDTRCPHCQKLCALRPNPFGKNAGECKHCGKLVEYNIEYE